MKMSSLFHGFSGERNGLAELPLRWGAALLGQRRVANTPPRKMEFVLGAQSVWRITGHVRGLRIECRHGRLWITQAGAVADVNLQPDQSFVAEDDGTVVVQPVPFPHSPADDSRRVAIGIATALDSNARLRIYRGDKSALQTRIGLDLVHRDNSVAWEQVVFGVLWLCGLFSVGYCLATVMQLTWPG